MKDFCLTTHSKFQGNDCFTRSHVLVNLMLENSVVILNMSLHHQIGVSKGKLSNNFQHFFHINSHIIQNNYFQIVKNNKKKQLKNNRHANII